MMASTGMLGDDFGKEPPYPPDLLFSAAEWSGVGDLEAFRGLERRLQREALIPLAYLRLHERLGFALLTADMQARWKRAYQQAASTNQAALAVVGSLAQACPSAQPIVLLGEVASLCTVHEDAGARPCRLVELLVPPSLLEQAAQHLEAQGMQREHSTAAEARLVSPSPASSVTCRLLSRLEGHSFAVDAAAVRERAVVGSPAAPILVAPVPPLEFVAAIDLHTQGDTGQGPVIVRPAERITASTLGQLLELPNVRVPAPHDQLLLAIAADVELGSTPGLHLWEQARMTTLPGFDAAVLASTARRFGFRAASHHRLTHLRDAWRAQVPERLLEALHPGWLASRMLAGCAPGSRLEAQRLQLLARWPTSSSLAAHSASRLSSLWHRLTSPPPASSTP